MFDPDPGAPDDRPAKPFAEWLAARDDGDDSEAAIVRDMTAGLRASDDAGIEKLKTVDWYVARRFLRAQEKGYVKRRGGVIRFCAYHRLGSHQHVYDCVNSLKLEREKHDTDDAIKWYRTGNDGWEPKDGNFGPKKHIQIVTAYRKRFDEPAPVKPREKGPTKKQLIERLARRTQQLIRVMDEERKIAADADRVPLVLNQVMGELAKEQEEERLPDIVPPTTSETPPPNTAPETPPTTATTAPETAPETATTATTSPEAPAKRGRPPRKGAAIPPEPAAKRLRSRPRKNATPDSTALNHSPQEASPAIPPETPPETATTSPEAPAKRGRPPRRGAAIPPEPTAKRPRGRPRKNATPASAPDSTALNHSPPETPPAIPPETETGPETEPVIDPADITQAIFRGLQAETDGHVPDYLLWVAFNDPCAVEWEVAIEAAGHRFAKTFATLAEALEHGNKVAGNKLRFFKNKPRHLPAVYFKKAEVKKLLPADPK